MKFKDYYKSLGVDPSASADEIKRAYRKLARQYHPDRNPESASEERFKEIGEAYEALKDPARRKQYDQLRAGGWRGGEDFRPPPGWGEGVREGGGYGGGFSDFSDFFESLFGAGLGGMRGSVRRQARGRDLSVAITIDLSTAYHGGKRQITLGRNGQRQSLEVTIPAGVSSGSRIRLAGQGEPGAGDGPPGDLIMEVNIADHPQFELEGNNVLFKLAIAPWEAALGAKVRVPTLGGEVSLNIPPGSSSGTRMRLKGRGLPGKTAGDQIVTLKVVVPRPASERERELYAELSRASSVNVRQT